MSHNIPDEIDQTYYNECRCREHCVRGRCAEGCDCTNCLVRDSPLKSAGSSPMDVIAQGDMDEIEISPDTGTNREGFLQNLQGSLLAQMSKDSGKESLHNNMDNVLLPSPDQRNCKFTPRRSGGAKAGNSKRNENNLMISGSSGGRAEAESSKRKCPKGFNKSTAKGKNAKKGRCPSAEAGPSDASQQPKPEQREPSEKPVKKELPEVLKWIKNQKDMVDRQARNDKEEDLKLCLLIIKHLATVPPILDHLRLNLDNGNKWNKWPRRDDLEGIIKMLKKMKKDAQDELQKGIKDKVVLKNMEGRMKKVKDDINESKKRADEDSKKVADLAEDFLKMQYKKMDGEGEDPVQQKELRDLETQELKIKCCEKFPWLFKIKAANNGPPADEGQGSGQTRDSEQKYTDMDVVELENEPFVNNQRKVGFSKGKTANNDGPPADQGQGSGQTPDSEQKNTFQGVVEESERILFADNEKTVLFSSFQGLEKAMLHTPPGEFPRYLQDTGMEITEKWGTPGCWTNIVILLCAAVYEMKHERLEQLNWDRLSTWGATYKMANDVGLQVKFVEEQLKSILHAYLALDFKNGGVREERIRRLVAEFKVIEQCMSAEKSFEGKPLSHGLFR